MPPRTPEEHLSRMWQRLLILAWKPNWKWRIDFAQNMIAEHVRFYTEQWLTEDETFLAMKIWKWLKDFFWIKNMINFVNYIKYWDINWAFNIITSFFENKNDEDFYWLDLVMVFDRLIDLIDSIDKEDINIGLIKIIESVRTFFNWGNDKKQNLKKSMTDLYLYFSRNEESMITWREIVNKIREYTN